MDYTTIVLPYEFIGMSLFMVEYGYEPQMSFDWEALSEGHTPKERLD